MWLDILPFSFNFTNARSAQLQERQTLATRSRHGSLPTRSSRFRTSTKLGCRIASARWTPSFSTPQSKRLSTHLTRRRPSLVPPSSLRRSRLFLTLCSSTREQARNPLRWTDILGEEPSSAHRSISWTRDCRCSDWSTSLSTRLWVDWFDRHLTDSCWFKVTRAFLVVGDGPAKNEAEALCNSYNLDAKWLGFKKGGELAACFASSDIFAFPSWTETFGQVVSEAQSSGYVHFELIENDLQLIPALS